MAPESLRPRSSQPPEQQPSQQPSDSPAQRFGAIPQVAQQQRALGYKQAQPPAVTAGSKPVSMRTPAPSYSPLKNNKGSINQTTRHLPIKGTIYISEVLTDKDGIETFDVKANRRSMTQYGESWETAYIEEDWRNRHDRLQPFVDWIVDGSAVTTASQLKDLTGYLRQYLCTSVETTKKDEDETSFDVTKVGAAIDRRDTLEEKFGFFKAGKGTSKDAKETKQLLIVVEVDLQKWQAARKKVQADRAAREVADRTAKEAEGRARRAIEYRRQQQLDQEENRRWEREALAARRDEVVDRDNDAVPVKPEWLLAEVDPNNPPELIDLSSPCLLYTSPSPRDGLLSRMPSSA